MCEILTVKALGKLPDDGNFSLLNNKDKIFNFNYNIIIIFMFQTKNIILFYAEGFSDNNSSDIIFFKCELII